MYMYMYMQMYTVSIINTKRYQSFDIQTFLFSHTKQSLIRLVAKHTYVFSADQKRHPEVPAIIEQWRENNKSIADKICTAIEILHQQEEQEIQKKVIEAIGR